MDFKTYFNSLIKKNFRELTTNELSLLVRHNTLSKKFDNEDEVMETLENEFTEAKTLRKNSITNTSGDAGSAGDLVPESVTVGSIIDLNTSAESFAFMSKLMGRQQLRSKKDTVPVIGRPSKGKIISESLSTAKFREAKEWLQSANTSKIDIESKKVYNNILLTDELDRFSIIELEALFIGRLKDWILLSIADAIINADSDDTTTNINYKGTKPSEVSALDYEKEARYVYDNGLRKVALAGDDGESKMDIGTPAGVDDIFALQSMVTSTSNPSKKIVLMDQASYYAYMAKEDFKDAAKNGLKSTIFSGALTNIAWSDIFVTDLIAKAGTDGLVSATAAENLTGSILVLDVTTIQHGDYENLMFNSDQDFAIGKLLEAYGYRGFANLQGKDDKVFVAIGYNVTLS